jgi:ferredoxin/flavodoxin---NADP+ reductase
MMKPNYLVAVVGAGPAGLYAAKQLVGQGAYVFLFNRDIKPGGLAEYGIYPDKHKMKDGLRAQFRQILAHPQVEYFGNILIGNHGDLRLEDLREMGFQALLVTVGAQDTKWLGLPGESIEGVYHAKDIVYYYNRLPPYSQQPYQIGKRVVIVGMGNVMLDIAHWLVYEKQVNQIIALARRGPSEVKFIKEELEYVVANLDLLGLDKELKNISSVIQSDGQSAAQLKEMVNAALKKAPETNSKTNFSLKFLVSPKRILGDASGRVCGLVLENNTLVAHNGEIKARGLGTIQTLDVDTVIFAIGDKVDTNIGLPIDGNEYLKNPLPRFPVNGLSYELCDHVSGCALEGTFVAGWSRKASIGLVGIAHKDGMNGAKVVMAYLQTLPTIDALPLNEIHERLNQVPKALVTKADLDRLEAVERSEAEARALEEYKFASNEDMLKAAGLREKMAD